MKKSVIILHSPCCSQGSPIKDRLRDLANSNNIDLEVKELLDVRDIMQYGTSQFPSLVIDGKVVPYKSQSDEALINLLN